MKKQIKDLKRHDAIRVNKEQYYRIAILLDEAGIKTTFNKRYIEWSPWEVHDKPDDVILYFKGGWDWNKSRYSGYKHYTIHLAKDFLLPEPKFKVGDGVIWGCEEKIITESKYDEHYKTWFHRFKENGSVWHNEAHMKPATQFTVGQQYEFFNGVTWHKGEFVTAVDGKAKRYFLGILGGCTGEALFEDIREIQHKEVKITRWINMSQSGNQVGKKCFESEIEACQHAPQSQNVFQVKLTGTYTI